ncbi:replication and copy control-associated protein [Listeria monocytogenes]|uniref:replication and copy control-associated protein n=1 Tax=Listeria ivanovii TaxID=1638 RepID=UPI0010DDC072|nr:replication and copy control-associated protein [Listeria ivanovii]EAD1625636.1 replication and copy control-associated protein [Listeria monocytogenes]EAE8754448.1 replication and copy control-associated protein [Listeria monocytogenes]UCK61684.1 replication and copy control-associated protein [Listeria ivanovii]
MARLIDRKDKEQAQVVQQADTTRQVNSTRKKEQKISAKDRKNIKINPDDMLLLDTIAHNFFETKLKQYELINLLLEHWVDTKLEPRQQKILKDLLKNR